MYFYCSGDEVQHATWSIDREKIEGRKWNIVEILGNNRRRLFIYIFYTFGSTMTGAQMMACLYRFYWFFVCLYFALAIVPLFPPFSMHDNEYAGKNKSRCRRQHSVIGIHVYRSHHPHTLDERTVNDTIVCADCRIIVRFHREKEEVEKNRAQSPGQFRVDRQVVCVCVYTWFTVVD